MSSQEKTPIAAVSFTPDSSQIVLTTASNGLSLFSTGTRQPEALPEELQQAIHARLEQLPGSITEAAFLPDDQVCTQNQGLLLLFF